MIHRLLIFIFTFALSVSFIEAKSKQDTFCIGKKSFLLNGKPFVIKAAELHYPRIPRPYWEHRIKMCKSLGMNAICLYVFWNIHEQKEGVFDFTGQNDVAEFCRLAHKHGMYVIVRPGPYVCAEWEMGGLPWWLLKKKDIRLREQDPYFMERVRLFENEVGRQLASLTITKGGPIIMVQVENEYGSYGEDKAYVSAIRDIVKGAFADSNNVIDLSKRANVAEDDNSSLVLFQCDWASNFTKNGLDDLVWTMNFGTGAKIDKQFEKLKSLRPDAPLMCSEYWSGWFDKWGARHETRPAADMVAGIDEMLSKGISFSLYMTHGGTSFGHWAGANSPGFAPDVTSYDYDAPINEYGIPTDKFFLLRSTLQKYSDKKLPDIPRCPLPLISTPKIMLDRILTLNDFFTNEKVSHNILTMEDMDVGWGMMEYSAILPDIPVSSILTVNECHDYGLVFINGKRVGRISRVNKESSVTLPQVNKGDTLTILVEAMGRINFGRAIKDYKGITKSVSITAHIDDNMVTWTLYNWRHRAISDDYNDIIKCMNHPVSSSNKGRIQSNGGYYRASFSLKRIGDTFVNMEAFGKGQVWINGHAIGRYWSIGPQQTLYVPGCWLKKGVNEIIVLDIEGPDGNPTVHFTDTPELNKLNVVKPERHDNPADRPQLTSLTPAASSSFNPGNGWQKVDFISPQKGRYIVLECLSTHAGDNVSVAELYVLDNQGKRYAREQWKVRYADSENISGNNTGEKAFDLQESTYWQTKKGASFPHMIVIDLGMECEMKGMEYLPRAEDGAPGSVKEFRIYCF